MRFFLVFIVLSLASVSFANAGLMDAGDAFLLPIDTVSVGKDTLRHHYLDSLPQKKPNWFVRAYRFCDKVLSPQRDSNYIDVQDYYNWCGELQLTSRFETYEVEDVNGFHLKMSPRWRTRLGPFFGWRWAFLGYNFDLKSLFINSKDTDIGGSVYSAAFGLDLFYRRVGGNYNIRKLVYGDTDFSSFVRGKIFDGIHVGMSRASFYYIINYKHYSHQAAFNQTNRQIRSAGSPIIGLSYAHNKVTFDWDAIASVLESSVTDHVAPKVFQQIKNNEYSFTGGYGYNWVFAKDWLAAGELTGSVGYLVHHSDVETRKDESESLLKSIDTFYRKNIAFNSTMRLAVLYNNGPWFAGTQAIMFYYQYGNGNVMIRNLLGSIYLYVGCNF